MNKTAKTSILAITLLIGCTSVEVMPTPAGTSLNLVCIQKNPKVIRADFMPVVESGFHRHGIDTVVYERGPLPAGCDARLRYTARQSWDFTTMLSYAELWLTDDRGREIGHGIYRHHAATFSWAVTKWFSTETKMTPVIDQLLAGFSGAHGAAKSIAAPPTHHPKRRKNDSKPAAVGEFSYVAQQIARSQNCSRNVELLKAEYNIELYTATCAGGRALVIYCEWGNCSRKK